MRGGTIMDFIKNITKKVTETAKVAAKKSGDMVELTKLKMNISSEEDKIEKEYVQMGKIVFETYEKGEKVGEEFEAHCEKIVSYRENINAMKDQILKLRNVKVCPECGAELESEVLFCAKCGMKQEIILKPVEETNNDDNDGVEIIESTDLTGEIDEVEITEETDKG